MMTRTLTIATVTLTLAIVGCGDGGDGHGDHDHAHENHSHAHDGHDHGAEHAGHDGHASGVDHDEVALGVADIGALKIEAWQGHGEAAAGKELHLVVKLAEDDKGATTVRAWIGTEDRFASVVGKGEHDASRGTYDIHAVCPDPLPEGATWWVEITPPDGEAQVGSIPLR